MAKNKESCLKALKHTIKRGVNIIGVVAPSEEGQTINLNRFATESGIDTFSIEELYSVINKNDFTVDIIISFLFWEKLKKPLIDKPRLGCINFHPAPLPEFRGVGGYNIAILEDLDYWGVSAHFIDENIDTGDIIKVIKFPINAKYETAISLERRSQKYLLKLYKEVLEMFLRGEELPRIKQGNGRYISMKELDYMKEVRNDESPEMIERKIRAFWFPPYTGAYIEINGKKYTLVDDKLLKEIGTMYQKYYKGSI